MGALIGGSIFAILVGLFKVFCMGMIFRKAGEGLWKAFVPIYSEYILGKIAGHAILGFIMSIIMIFTMFASGYSTINAYKYYVASKNVAQENATNGVVYTTDADGNKKALNVPQKPTGANRTKQQMALQEIANTRALTTILSIASFVLAVIIYYGLCSKFDKGIGFLLGLIFLHVVFIAILAFDDSEYIDYSNRFY